MTDQPSIIEHNPPVSASADSVEKKRVLIFSPDADLARFLLLNLEEKFAIVREHRLESFETAIREIAPELILVDLFTFSHDIIKQLDIVRRTAGTVPVIALRAYMPLTPELNESIEESADIVFYKPVDINLVAQAIEDLLT